MKKWHLKPWLFGIIAGSLFVFSEIVFNFYPPTAYTFCLTCHTRDLVNTAVNFFFNTNYQTTAIARRVVMITSPGVMIGAFLAARLFGEYTLQKRVRPVYYFIFGFLVMTTGIVIFGCPTRIIIRSGYGDIYGLIALAGMFIGIWNGTAVIKRIARKKI